MSTAVLLACLLRPVEGQILYGSLVGKVSDPSGAAVAGVKVVILNKATNLSREALTDAFGSFDFPNLPTGSYDLNAGAAGFSTFVRTGVPVSINNVSRVDLTLQVGAVSETITVGSQAALLQTDRAEVRSEMGARELVNLPVPIGRNYQHLFRTLPGFGSLSNSNSAPTNPSRSLIFNVNGVSNASNNTRIDGVSSNNPTVPHTSAYIPSLEAIEAVNVVTNSFDAENGLAGGAAINVQIKSGTNDLHGSLFSYHTDQHMKAKPFFLPVGQGKPKLIDNQFGATLGGPIKRNRLFYFVAYEGTLDRASAALFGTVPTTEMRAGDMSASPRLIYDPATGDNTGAGRTPFANNVVPGSRVSGISRKLVDLTPLPNLDRLTNNYYASAPFIFDRHTGDSKLSWNPTDKITTFLRFGILRYTHFNQHLFGPLGGPPVNGGNPGNGYGGTYSSTAAITYTVTPTFVIDAYYGYQRADTTSQQLRLDEKLGLDFLRIPGTNGARRFEGGWPRFEVNGFTNIGVNEEYMPYYRRDPSYQYVANFNWTKGTHNIRFGVDINPKGINQQQAHFVGNAPAGGTFHGAQGGFTFSGGPTAVRGGASPNQFNGYANFLLGLPTRIGKINHVSDEYGLRMNLYSLYVRDRWNATQKLTIDYGVRWEYFPLMTRANRGLERYDPDLDRMLVCGLGSVPRDCGVEISRRMFAPRLGIAYRLRPTFVVRMGYGLTNDPFQAPELLRGNYPELVPLDLNGANTFLAAGTLEQGIPPVIAPDLSTGVISVDRNVALNSVPKRLNRGYVQSWNFTVQKELKSGFTAQAGYVATRQIRPFAYVNINAGQVLGGGQAGQPLVGRFGRLAGTTLMLPVGTSQYNGLQMSLERRFAQGFQVAANYTWSKSIGVVDNSTSSPRVGAFDYFSMNRSILGFDRTHNLHVSSIVELPFGRGKRWVNKNRVGTAMLSGWQMNHIWSFMSGTPFSITAAGTSLDLPGSTQRADQVKPSVEKLGGAGRGLSFFDPFAFVPVSQPRFGTAGFNSLRGPGVVNWDAGLFREFVVTERWKVQFRAEAFNTSNTPHFANPGGNVSNLNLNPNGTVRDLGGFTEITGVSAPSREGIDERQFRVGLRISF